MHHIFCCAPQRCNSFKKKKCLIHVIHRHTFCDNVSHTASFPRNTVRNPGTGESGAKGFCTEAQAVQVGLEGGGGGGHSAPKSTGGVRHQGAKSLPSPLSMVRPPIQILPNNWSTKSFSLQPQKKKKQRWRLPTIAPTPTCQFHVDSLLYPNFLRWAALQPCEFHIKNLAPRVVNLTKEQTLTVFATYPSSESYEKKNATFDATVVVFASKQQHQH